MRIKSGIYYWWSKQGSIQNFYNFLQALQGLNRRPTGHTAGSSFDIQFPFQTFDSVTPVTNVNSCNDPSSRSATSASRGGGTNTASFTQRQVSWPGGPGAVNIFILATTSHSSLWHCSGFHAPPDESEYFPHLPGRLTWRNPNEFQA